ncbi:MAG: Mediator of RNA polymerase II transcription subunit 7 [Caeruleum heppii]|nr:MAG: Mediator of RNA polymerase II transcription subunit 7 [Caeruleum heppii]
MTDPQQQPHQPPTLSATFPAPPPFYKYFTPDNNKRLKEIHHTHRETLSDVVSQSTTTTAPDWPGTTSPTSSVPTHLPPDLLFLVPPRPPTEGSYNVFGDPYHVHDILPTLSSQGIPQLYPSSPTSVSNLADSTNATGTDSDWTLDRAFYLRKIAKSLLLNFLDLVGVLSKDPAESEPKMADLRTLFLNAHHLLNEYRPHQARETLILMMEAQLERSRKETDGIRRMRGKVEEVLQTLREEAEMVEGLVERGGKKEEDGDGGEEMRVWETLYRKVGEATVS